MGGVFIILLGVIALAIITINTREVNIVAGSFFSAVLIMLGIIAEISKYEPSALDVYRGRTELKITGEYKDSVFIPTDTTVIFRKEKEWIH